MEKEIKFYVIESVSDYYGSRKYRFASIYNGSRGSWYYSKSKAIEDGKNHKRLVLLLLSQNIQEQKTDER